MFKKIVLLLFFLINISSFSDTTISWNVEKSNNNKIVVTCNLSGDIYHTFYVDIQPFSGPVLADGQDYDFSTGIILKVEKELPYSDDIAYYKCYLEKNYKTLATFHFRVKNILVIEEV